MVIRKKGSVFFIDGKEFKIGGGVFANDESEYMGLYHGKYLCPPGYNIQEHISNENDQRGQHQSQYLRERVRENTERTGQNTLHFRR